MRVRLNPDFQKKFFLKLKKGKSWKELSQQLSASEVILKGCTFAGNSIPNCLYEKIRSNETDAFILERLEDNWGQRKGGANSASTGKGNTKTVKEPKFDEKLAEIIGIMLGDGNSYVNREKGIYQVRIAGNLYKEREYLNCFVMPLFEEVFGIKGRLVEKPRVGGIYVCFDSREMVNFLDKAGVHAGERKKQVGIPDWITGKNKFLSACIRGLVDSDGSVYRLARKYPNLIRIGFKNTNSFLLESYRKGMIVLGFHPSKVIYGNVFITRQEDVKRFANEIGFNNPKNKNKLRIIAPSSSGQG